MPMICREVVKCSKKQVGWNADCYGVNTCELATKIFSVLDKFAYKGILKSTLMATIEIKPCPDDIALEIIVKELEQ